MFFAGLGSFGAIREPQKGRSRLGSGHGHGGARALAHEPRRKGHYRGGVKSGRAAQIKVREADYRRHRELFPANSADLVICNPPYRALGGGDRSQLTGVAAARHETTATKQDVIAAAAYLLRYGGRFALVQRADRTAEWCAALEAAKLAVKRLQFVHSRQGLPAKLVLLEARMNGRADCTVLPPLFVHDDHGDYTPDILRLYGKEVAD